MAFPGKGVAQVKKNLKGDAVQRHQGGAIVTDASATPSS
jgi:hypothetical protein